MPSPRIRLLAALVAALGLTACGGADREMPEQIMAGSGGYELSASDAADVNDAERTIQGVCGATGEPADAADLGPAVTTLAQELRMYPDQIYEIGSSDRAVQVRILVEQTVASMRSCAQPAQVQRLQRALRQVGT